MMAKQNLWPTPRATDGEKGGRVTPRKGREGGTLIEALSQRSWPTPTSRDWKGGTAESCKNVPTNALLGRVVHQFATPTIKGNYNRKGASPTSGDGLATQVGGSLNPTWVEWLMGFPLEWTVCEPLATRKSRSVRRPPSAS
jgi:DNA (cytosine-5)-methyltransferase 1